LAAPVAPLFRILFADHIIDGDDQTGLKPTQPAKTIGCHPASCVPHPAEL
jgi:hypothetical protein